ncbi:hypothetical protein L211DRAFT_854543 [Terfezia boudieri ATCC MYA-4762]|uniref:Uncharacterized protein n=1 Tax=Terfezia boudieri ATCC MYA-4762 TaxID=1051890 RepID=A0A3N4L572_9PEZI|nr:hypothetical protein L211DRAFT_854543 [Terfezia boudieri ATCC MYA-4762]
MLKAGIKAQEYATITGRAIGTRKNQLMDMKSGKFEELMQRNCEVMFIRKKAYILYKCLTEQEELAEGGADDCLSNEDVGADIEEDYDDKPNKEDDDKHIGALLKQEALESSSEEEEEAQLTESDSNERRAKKLFKAKIIEALLSSDTEDDYRDSTEEDHGEVNE